MTAMDARGYRWLVIAVILAGCSARQAPPPAAVSSPPPAPARSGPAQPAARAARVSPAPASPGPAAPDPNLPAELDRGMIADAIQQIRPDVTNCGLTWPATGTVKVSLKVGADGRVASVTVKATPDPKLGACVAEVMQRAKFPATRNGGGFAYPWMFPAAPPH